MISRFRTLADSVGAGAVAAGAVDVPGGEFREDGVAADDVGKPRLLKRLQLPVVKNALIPEAVSVTNALELVGDDSPEGGADASPGNMIFSKATDPKID